MTDVSPPDFAELSKPLHCLPQPLVEACPLFPPELTEFRVVDSVPAIIEGPVVRVLHPATELGGCGVGDSHGGKDPAAEFKIRDLIRGPDIVNLTELALVEDGVEGIGCVPGVKVPAERRAVTVKDNRPAASEEACELGDDLCARGQLDVLLPPD